MSHPPSPFEMKQKDKDTKNLIPTPLASERSEFLSSKEAKGIRLLSEFSEFPLRVAANGVRGTFLFFGSARAMGPEDHKATVSSLNVSLATATDEERPKIEKRLAGLQKLAWMTDACEKTTTLARILTEWAMSPEGKDLGRRCTTNVQNAAPSEQPLCVCTGGGPGTMEAANKGAHQAGGKSMGVAVTLPFEPGLNPYVSKGLNFRFEYFFSRKFCEVYCAKALICAPGGFGTCDEFFEVLTLMQTGKCPKVPIVLLGKKFWNDIINFNAMADYGVITQAEVDAICFTDSAEEARDFIVAALRKEVAELEAQQ